MSVPSDAMDGERGGSSSRGYSYTNVNASRLSSVAVESADVTLDERQMYAVEWREGDSFGFTVTPINSDRGVVLLLVRRTAQRAQLEAAGLQDVVPGDVLIGIGDEKVYHLGVENAAKYMRSVQKPVRLTLQLSPYSNSAKSLPDLAPNEYHYLWEDGPLGIVLTYDLKSKLPMVKRLSDKANDVVRRDVEVGDQLMYANDLPSSEYSMDEVMALLREMPKPVLLRFRKQLADDHLVELPELAENEYEFLWDYGPLGLVIGMSRSGLPFVRSFTGLGTSRQLPLVHQDDEIVMVNDRSAREEGFREVMQYLMNVPKPAVLRFRRRLPGEEHERVSNESHSRSSAQQRGSSMLNDRISTASSNSSTQQQYGQQPKPASPALTAPHGMLPPPSPQVPVALDRSRLSSASVGFGNKSEVRSSAASDEFNRSTNSSVQASPPRPSGKAQPSNGYPTRPGNENKQKNHNSSEHPSPFEEAAGWDPRTTETIPFDDDRETAIIPPDPRNNSLGNQNRSSIFSFQFDEGPQEIMTGPTVGGGNAPPKDRRLSVKTGSVPSMGTESELSDDRRSGNESLGRSQSSRVGRPEDMADNNQRLPPVAKLSGSRVAKTEVSPAAQRSSVNNQRDHIAKPAAVSAEDKKSKSYIDTADLFAEPTPTAPAPVRAPVAAAPVPVRVQAPVAATPVRAPPAVKKTITVGTKQYEDTAELFAEPAPPKPVAAPVPAPKKPVVDTAELFAEPTKTPLASSQIKKAEAPKPTTPPPAPAPAPVPTPAPVAAVAAGVSSPSSEGQEFFKIDENAFYTVQWTDGPFGSTVREAESSEGPIMLITKRTGKQTCAGLRRIAVGDILVRIGDQSIPAMGFEKATRYLRKVPKPVSLTFQAID